MQKGLSLDALTVDCDLKWVLFAPPTSELHYCTGAYRISPTDVNSRPSSCLTNFLLNGKLDKTLVFYLYFVLWVDLQTNCRLTTPHPDWPQVDRCCWSSQGSRGQRSSATCSAATEVRSSCTCLTATAPPWRIRLPSARAAEAEWRTTASLYVQHIPSAVCMNDPEMLMMITVFFVCFRTLVNLWGRTGSRLCLSLPMIPLGNYQLRGPKPSWNVILDTGRWSSPRPPSSTCRQWVARRDTVVLLEDFYQSSESSIT